VDRASRSNSFGTTTCPVLILFTGDTLVFVEHWPERGRRASVFGQWRTNTFSGPNLHIFGTTW